MHIFKVEIIVTHARLSQDYMPTKKSTIFSGNHHKLSLLNAIYLITIIRIEIIDFKPLMR